MTAQRLVMAGCIALALYLALVPLVFLVHQSFHATTTAGGTGAVTLDNYRAFADPHAWRLFANSIVFAAGSALFAFVVGTTLAWINERSNAPFKRTLFALSIVPLVIPGVLFVVAWILLASPKIGLVNLVLQRMLGTDVAFVDVYTMGGMIFVDGLHQSPIAFLLMSAAFRAMDPALEESALTSGARLPRVAWQITMKLAWPAACAAVLLLFVRAIESFEVPAMLGTPAGLEVFTSAIYKAMHQYPGRTGLASAYAIALLLLAAIALLLQFRVSRRTFAHVTVTGRGYRQRPIDLGRWRHAAGALAIAYALVIVGLPLLVLAWASFQRFYSVPSMQALATASLEPYRTVLAFPALGQAVVNSLVLAASCATIVIVLAAVLAWIAVRSRLPGRAALDTLVSLPMVVPGIVLGLAIMLVYLQIPLGLYGTLGILLVAYVTRFLPYGMRYATASLVQVHRELEESAMLSGASWARTFRRIVLPLVAPGLLAGWIYVAIVSLRELSTSILLYSPGSEVLAIVVWELWENGQYTALSALGVMYIAALLGLTLLAHRFSSAISAPTAR